MKKINTTIYETELAVRPDDIDMFQHVHSSKYMDYVLAARYEQMERCYQNPMESYLKEGLGWVITKCEMHFKRSLKLGDYMIVQTQLIEATEKTVKVGFAIKNKHTGKVCSDGNFNYALIQINSGKAVSIPDWAMAKYLVDEV